MKDKALRLAAAVADGQPAGTTWRAEEAAATFLRARFALKVFMGIKTIREPSLTALIRIISQASAREDKPRPGGMRML